VIQPALIQIDPHDNGRRNYASIDYQHSLIRGICGGVFGGKSPTSNIARSIPPLRPRARGGWGRPRYALFTQVGIAGDDDVDAPDLITPRLQCSIMERLIDALWDQMTQFGHWLSDVLSNLALTADP
jgi:hypothetical protein